MTSSRANRYFEDYVIGMEQEVGSVSLSEAEMIEFASKYDPQDFHVDPEKAAVSHFGGLIASGWHTTAAVMRVLVDSYLDSASSLGSPGVDELRWLAPVRPEDVLTVHPRITDARRSTSNPDRGLLHTTTEIFNQDDALVMTIKAVNLVACREAEDSKGVNADITTPDATGQ